MKPTIISNIIAAPVDILVERHSTFGQYFQFADANAALIIISNAVILLTVRDAFSNVVAVYSIGDGISIFNDTTCVVTKDVYEKDLPAGLYTYSFMVSTTTVEYPFVGRYVSFDVNNSRYVNSHSYNRCCPGI